MLLTLRIATASVWILFGLVFKVLNVVPRHEAIVATILGSAVAGPVTLLIGLAETAMGIWILSRWRPRTCAAAQTIAIVSMNVLELTLARDQLLAPLPMVCANCAFLAVGWYLALRTPSTHCRSAKNSERQIEQEERRNGDDRTGMRQGNGSSDSAVPCSSVPPVQSAVPNQLAKPHTPSTPDQPRQP